MGFTKPDLPDFEPDTFLKKPLMERMRILATDWAENGFGAPRMVHTIYIVKLVVFFAIGGITVATATKITARTSSRGGPLSCTLPPKNSS